MPNWTSNKLVVKGPVKAIEFFKKCAEGEDDDNGRPFVFSLQSLVPMPKGLEGTDCPNKDGLPEWYHWHIEYWGTKWDVCEPVLEKQTKSPASLTYRFNSAWCPPAIALETISALFPMLSFTLTYQNEDSDHESTVTFGKVMEEESF
jgi:hypothetical protein